MPKIQFHTHPDLAGMIPNVQPATKFVPQWYKDMPKDTMELNQYDKKAQIVTHAPMIKRCVPIRDYMTSGYIIPYWVDTLLRKDTEGTYQDIFGHRPDWMQKYNLGVDWHTNNQFENSPLVKLSDGEKLVKLLSPWMVRTPKGYSTLFFSPFYHESNVMILPAIVDTDTHAIPTNFPAVLIGNEVRIEIGDPIIQALPFKRESWTSEIVTKDNDANANRQQMFQILGRFASHYTKNLWQRKHFR